MVWSNFKWFTFSNARYYSTFNFAHTASVTWNRPLPFLSSEAALLLANTKNRDLWEGPIFWARAENSFRLWERDWAGRIRLFQNGCPQSSRYSAAGQGERRLWERDWAVTCSTDWRWGAFLHFIFLCRQQLQEQAKLVVEENALLMEQQEIQDRKVKEMQRVHGQEGWYDRRHTYWDS